MERMKKLFLLRGYDFKHVKIREDLHLFYDSINYAMLPSQRIFNYLNNTELCELSVRSFTENGILDLARLGVKNINFLSHIEHLNFTNIYLRHNDIEDISSFSKIIAPNLKVLHIRFNQIKDISALSAMTAPNLSFLDLEGNEISNVTPLYNLKSLEWLDLRGNPDITKESCERLEQNLPSRCGIYHNFNSRL